MVLQRSSPLPTTQELSQRLSLLAFALRREVEVAPITIVDAVPQIPTAGFREPPQASVWRMKNQKRHSADQFDGLQRPIATVGFPEEREYADLWPSELTPRPRREEHPAEDDDLV